MISNFRKEFRVNSLFIEYKISDEISLERSRKRRGGYEKRGETPRPWDSDEGVGKRILTYYRDIEPTLERLAKEGRLITIDAVRSIEEVRKETSLKFSKERG